MDDILLDELARATPTRKQGRGNKIKDNRTILKQKRVYFFKSAIFFLYFSFLVIWFQDDMVATNSGFRFFLLLLLACTSCAPCLSLLLPSTRMTIHPHQLANSTECFAAISQPNSFLPVWGQFSISQPDLNATFHPTQPETTNRVFAGFAPQQGLLSKQVYGLQTVLQNKGNGAPALAVIPFSKTPPFYVDLGAYLYSYPILGFGHALTLVGNSTFVFGRAASPPFLFTLLRLDDVSPPERNQTKITRLPFEDLSGGLGSGELFSEVSVLDDGQNWWWMTGSFQPNDKVYLYAIDVLTGQRRMQIDTQGYSLVTLDYHSASASLVALVVSVDPKTDLQMYSLMHIQARTGHWDIVYRFPGSMDNAFGSVSGLDESKTKLFLVTKAKDENGFRLVSLQLLFSSHSLSVKHVSKGPFCGPLCPLALACR